MARRRALVVGAVAAALVFGGARAGEARHLQDVLGFPGSTSADDPIAAALRPLGSVIGQQIANQIPTLSTSAGYTYEYNPDLEVYERSTKTFGPLFSERAVTLGRGKFNINTSYTYLDFAKFNGKDIGNLKNRVAIANVDGQRTFAGLIRPDLVDQFPGLSDNQIFSEVTADLRLEAQIVDFSVTYGLLDNLDVNVDIPVIRTYAHLSVSQEILDPRFVAELPADFAAQFPDLSDGPARDRESAVGIGDVRLRSKYLAYEGPVRVAGLLDFIMATGNKADFQGTGDWRLGTFLIASGTLFDILEPHAQGGIEWNMNDVDISQAKYGAGITAQVADFAALTVDFLGRSEFGALGRIPSEGRLPAVRDGNFVVDDNGNLVFEGRPLFLNIKRNDILDLAIGGKVSILPQAILFVTFTVPLNEDGLRADFVPTAGIEATF
jgi:hypothetical protein